MITLLPLSGFETIVAFLLSDTLKLKHDKQSVQCSIEAL